jgi:hypothetical protein
MEGVAQAALAPEDVVGLCFEQAEVVPVLIWEPDLAEVVLVLPVELGLQEAVRLPAVELGLA